MGVGVKVKQLHNVWGEEGGVRHESCTQGVLGK